MFSICTAYINPEKMDQTLDSIKKNEKNFNKDIGVLYRVFFQCQTLPYIIWSLTEWESETHHNKAANSIMKTRFDDRFASIAFGPDPYFEIFCSEDINARIGNLSEEIKFVIVIHSLISEKQKEGFIKLRGERLNEYKSVIPWFRSFTNSYNSYEYVFYMGFRSKEEYEDIRKINNLFLEEYLFTGINKPLQMSKIASYNQYICKPMKMK
ncbi:MAG: hypothetical protein ACXAC7_13430 [Candidatus Hodarchaeales archaeon]